VRIERADSGTWCAELRIDIERRGTASLLARAHHRGPLRVQRPLYPEGSDICHVYLLHPPGGIVPGDELEIDVAVGPGAGALFTTPAATKVYRSDGRCASQRQMLHVAAGASLEWLPEETIVFDGARFEADTRVVLEPTARLVAWDVQCLGRPAVGERFTRGRFMSRFEVFRAEAPLYVDRFICDGDAGVLSANHGLGGHAAFGSMVVSGASPDWLDVVRGLFPSPRPTDLFSATIVGGGDILLCKYLGSSAGLGRRTFGAIWEALRPRLLVRAAVPPRIWST
jgi:urease accessory protein